MNQSFTDMHDKLTEKGLNVSYLLDTLNPDVEKINLRKYGTVEDFEKVMDEITTNPWYFFREVIRIPNDLMGNTTEFILNDVNMKMILAHEELVSFLVINSKSVGKTVGIVSLMVYEWFRAYYRIYLMDVTKRQNPYDVIVSSDSFCVNNERLNRINEPCQFVVQCFNKILEATINYNELLNHSTTTIYEEYIQNKLPDWNFIDNDTTTKISELDGAPTTIGVNVYSTNLSEVINCLTLLLQSKSLDDIRNNDLSPETPVLLNLATSSLETIDRNCKSFINNFITKFKDEYLDATTKIETRCGIILI